MPRVLTASRVRVPRRARQIILRRCGSCASTPKRAAAHLGVRHAKDPQLFIEFSESPTEMSHRAQASRLPEEIKLEKHLQSLVTYAPDAWELWTEVSLGAPTEA